jgi:hypothetical protein
LSTTARYVVLAVALVVCAWLFLTLHSESPSSAGHSSSDRNQPAESTIESVGQIANSSEPARTKSRIRIDPNKPTIDETTELLRNTIVPVVDLPEQSLTDRVVMLNRLIKECGVPPDQLTISITEDDAAAERPIANIVFPELRVREIPLVAVLQYTADSTRLRFEVSAGNVECFSASSIHRNTRQDRSDEASDSADPFAKPSVLPPGIDLPSNPFNEH